MPQMEAAYAVAAGMATRSPGPTTSPPGSGFARPPGQRHELAPVRRRPAAFQGCWVALDGRRVVAARSGPLELFAVLAALGIKGATIVQVRDRDRQAA